MISIDDIDLNSLVNRLRPLLAQGLGLVQATLPVGSAVSLTTATAKDVTTLVLPAPGVYLVWGYVDLAMTGCSSTVQQAGVGIAANTLLSQAGSGIIGPDPTTSDNVPVTTFTGTKVIGFGPTVVTATAPQTTVHLVASATFSAGTCTAYGTIYAQQL